VAARVKPRHGSPQRPAHLRDRKAPRRL